MKPFSETSPFGRNSASADDAGPAGHSAPPWPSGPVWAPPAEQLPTNASTTGPAGPRLPAGSVATSVSGGRPDRSRRSAFAAAVVVAILAGGGAGYAGATLADNDTSPAATPSAAPLSYAGDLDVSSLVAQVEPSVVTIQTMIEINNGFRSGTAEAAGTGIILTADGQVVTNAHVVADATEINVTVGSATYRARLVGADSANDVALLQLVDASGLTPATIGDSDSVVVGEDAVAIGNALALEGGVSVTKGIISALDRSIEVQAGHLTHLIQTDAAISSGNSGGPLVNAAGEVIGMNSAGATSSATVSAENIGFALPINSVMAIVANLGGEA